MSAPRRPFLKVCGITRAEDARAAVEAGARAVGFVLAPESPRYVAPERAAAMARDLPPGVARVGVTVDGDVGRLRALVRAIGLTAVQVHGEADPAALSTLQVPVVKALAFPPGAGLDRLEPYRAFPILLDGWSPQIRGGTGARADWELAAKAGAAGFRVLLAGGLSEDNVLEAVAAVAPLAVDVNSGVEREPGVKDPARIRAVVARLATLPPRDEADRPW